MRSYRIVGVYANSVDIFISQLQILETSEAGSGRCATVGMPERRLRWTGQKSVLRVNELGTAPAPASL